MYLIEDTLLLNILSLFWHFLPVFFLIYVMRPEHFLDVNFVTCLVCVLDSVKTQISQDFLSIT